jgi:hypothetical protein
MSFLEESSTSESAESAESASAEESAPSESSAETGAPAEQGPELIHLDSSAAALRQECAARPWEAYLAEAEHELAALPRFAKANKFTRADTEHEKLVLNAVVAFAEARLALERSRIKTVMEVERVQKRDGVAPLSADELLEQELAVRRAHDALAEAVRNATQRLQDEALVRSMLKMEEDGPQLEDKFNRVVAPEIHDGASPVERAKAISQKGVAGTNASKKPLMPTDLFRAVEERPNTSARQRLLNPFAIATRVVNEGRQRTVSPAELQRFEELMVVANRQEVVETEAVLSSLHAEAHLEGEVRAAVAKLDKLRPSRPRGFGLTVAGLRL